MGEMHSTCPSLLNRLKHSSDNTVAWSRFVEMYTPLFMHWIQRLGLDRSESADIVQEVMLSLLVRMPSFQYDQNGNFRAWLRAITLNKCRDYLRRRQAQRKHETRKTIELNQSDDSVFSDDEYFQAITRRALQLMKSEFEESTWRACWESAVLGRSANEIAAELGISPNAVYLAKGRVLRRLRQELEGML